MEDDMAQDAAANQDRRLWVLERLLASSAAPLKPTLDQAGPLITEEIGADMVDAFLFEPETATLIALGASQTPLARQRHAAGLDRIPLTQEDRNVDVFTTGIPYLTGHADQDPKGRHGVAQVLGICSLMAVRLEVDTEVRGVLEASSLQPEQFTEQDLHFLQVVACCLGLVIDRAELAERRAALAVTNAHLYQDLANCERRLREIVERMVEVKSTPITEPLTGRQREVLQLLAQGKTNAEIAAALNIRLTTVKGHVQHIIAKLEVTDRTQAAVRASQLGLLPESSTRPSIPEQSRPVI
jgi:DNA-binding CsgD family transcriptional regulator